MPNRILRESIWTSESLASVSLLAEALFLKLIPYADDFGRFDARLPVLAGRVLPLRSIRVEQLETWLTELESAGMIRFYVVRGVRFGCIPSWDRWNEKRAKTSRHPGPEEADALSPVQADASTCAQTQTDANKCASIRDTGHGTREARSGRVRARGAPDPPTEPEWVTYASETWPTWPPDDVRSAWGSYQSRGWRTASGPITDWRAAAKTCYHRWAGNGHHGPGGNCSRPKRPSFVDAGRREGGEWKPSSPEEEAAFDAARRTR